MARLDTSVDIRGARGSYPDLPSRLKKNGSQIGSQTWKRGGGGGVDPHDSGSTLKLTC